MTKRNGSFFQHYAIEKETLGRVAFGIADMIGRRGRFLMIQMAGFSYLYGRIAARPSPEFLVLLLQDNLFDAASSTLLELYSPRGTDDFTMATGNALLCLAFGFLVY